MSHRPTSLLKRFGTLAGASLAGVVASSAAIASVQSASAPKAAAAANEPLRVVTANLAFRGPDAVRNDWNTIGPEADIVFVQEAKNVRLRDILGDGWVVRQDTSSEDRQGSAVVIRKSAVKSIGELQLVKGTDASDCNSPEGGIMTRWIARVDVQLNNHRWLRAASLHMPPARCQNGLGSPYAVMADNAVAFAKRSEPLLVLGADWNKVVDADPNEIGARTGLKPRGPDTGSRIDGFYVSPAITTNNLHLLPQTGSDHRPVQMTIGVPAP
ncbi:endonuclease/exonuclease/phosphatase family protein [Stigmatella aurantiaca]|uniref:AP endonuclease, family 1 n=1 Tax=Stigmatella aurantiaca (strain DW4/3-1) TaxID=378806 RepID=Q094F5_STIAD|nr:endonuclease/exonuclease/phosphatase family protein [Stigmatella aurantiaca]ADO68162.1 AP endonuclease, family 1 [Stigmatella aurantiaca DW4/3-1]EAU67106.1 endonuclease/exonuclease/phosphatase family [Stigmatella aurantiaca DW4/3-1]